MTVADRRVQTGAQAQPGWWNTEEKKKKFTSVKKYIMVKVPLSLSECEPNVTEASVGEAEPEECS